MSRHFLSATFLTLMLFVAAIDCKKLKQKEKRANYMDRNQTRKRLLLVVNECEADEFRCTNGNCISSDAVCDTHIDCFYGEDEYNCPTDCSGPHQFKCENSDKCIGIIDKCDGRRDCIDYSDEAFCDSFECAAGRFKCATSNECIEPFFVCDKFIDCKDGSDEKNCINGTCSSSEWQCADKGACIPSFQVCDGSSDCPDYSDEVGCTCSGNEFHCSDGRCIPSSYKCDGDNDCGDESDEIDCPTMPPGVCRDVLTYVDCYHMNETTHPICLIYADGDKFCRKYCGFCIG